jgi:hypothetical protein
MISIASFNLAMTKSLAPTDGDVGLDVPAERDLGGDRGVGERRVAHDQNGI